MLESCYLLESVFDCITSGIFPIDNLEILAASVRMFAPMGTTKKRNGIVQRFGSVVVCVVYERVSRWVCRVLLYAGVY